MAVKDVEHHYSEICEQYHEMMDILREMEESLADDMISPERVEQLKAQIEPIKNTYEQFSYWMFLLHQPQRKSKVARYRKQNKKLLEKLSSDNSLDAVKQRTQEALAHIGDE